MSLEAQARLAYEKYYIGRDYEQVDLFRMLRERFSVEKVVYPGSYIQVSPSFVFQDVVYIDSDPAARKYFASGGLDQLVLEHKDYAAMPAIDFHPQDFGELHPEFFGRFDLMISQYAGFISQVCKPYLKPGGFLLVNNSHGDAGLAYLDPDYELIAAVQKSKGKYRLTETSLEEYFVPKKEIPDPEALIRTTGRGIGYIKTAPLYLFRRVEN